MNWYGREMVQVDQNSAYKCTELGRVRAVDPREVSRLNIDVGRDCVILGNCVSMAL